MTAIPIRNALTSVLLVSFVGQQIAFASPTLTVTSAAVVAMAAHSGIVTPQALNAVTGPLPTPKSAKQAMVVIQIAEARPFATYFENGGTEAEIKRLNDDMQALTVANKFGGLADDVDTFLPWWSQNQASILLSRTKMKSDNLEGFFTAVYIKFKIESTNAQRDPNAIIQWLSSKVTSPLVRTASFTAFAIVLGTFTFTLGLVKGAMIAGPAAGAIGALVEPIIRPIREKASIIGSRLLGSAGVKLTNQLFKENGGEKAGQELTALEQDAKAAREGAKEARQLLNSMGYDLTPSQYAANMNKLHNIWNETNRVWVQTNPSLFKDGRSVFQDATAGRPQSYAIQVMSSLQGAEQARQGIEQNIDRIIQRTGGSAKAIEDAATRMLKAFEARELALQANAETLRLASDEWESARTALKDLGATDVQVNRINELRRAELINVRHTAYALASNVLNEIMYEEYNRTLPPEVQKIQSSLREGLCLDYFHNVYKEQVTKILTDMDFKLQASERVIASAQKALELKVVGSKDEAAVKAAPARQGVRNYLREKAQRATSVLGRLNRMATNSRVIERTGDLKTEKSADGKTEVKVETAKRVVGQK